MNTNFLNSVPDSEFPLENNMRFKYSISNVDGKNNINFNFNWLDNGNMWERRIEGVGDDLVDAFKWVFANAKSKYQFNEYIDMIESDKFDNSIMNKV
jgi:hypothetical protein